MVRDEQAARTRTRILDAASDLFLDRGYARTTIKDIADQAGVARDTVYAVFGSKARVLTALIDLRLVPDGSVARARERPEALAVRDEIDQRKQIELFASFIAGISTQVRPVFEILRTASAVEPDMANEFQEMDRYRMMNMQTYAKWIAARGPLRVSTRRAGEIIWTLASPDVGRMLCDELGWTETQHARWLSDTLARTLLPDD
ncbi:MAG: TetR/AcrR family transcriptional regulator [Actinobacteria bacterium]|nr:TetR/AcrR family transcriptional regulator [Actinomycetota bacterium]